MEQGGPFTIGRVIHSNRHATLSAWIGGVAVFDRAPFPDEEMKKLATDWELLRHRLSKIPFS
jgi:hypothetical protein